MSSVDREYGRSSGIYLFLKNNNNNKKEKRKQNVPVRTSQRSECRLQFLDEDGELNRVSFFGRWH